MSKDALRHWVLWDLAARRQVVSGDLVPCGSVYPPCRGFAVALAGATLAVRGSAGIEVRAAATGELLTTLAAADTAGLASDGSYVWIATASRLQARSRSGTSLIDIAGDYSHAAVFAAPDQLRVAGGPAGSHVIEVISTVDGQVTTVPFVGAFASWFDDGRRFLTVIGTAVYVYTSAGVRETLGSLPTVERLTGQGDFLWTLAAGTLRVYAVSDLSAPLQTLGVTTLTAVVPAGPVIGILPYGVEHFDLVSLGATVTVRQIAVPAAYLSAFGGDATGHWMVGGNQGVVFDGDALTGAPGTAWLDHDRLAVATYRLAVPKYGIVVFDTMNIYDGEGTLLGPARLPEPHSSWLPVRGAMTSIDGRLVYLRYRNAVYDTATGAVVWQGDAAASNGTVVGHHVVYTLGRKVYRATFAAPGAARAAIGW